MNSEATYLKNNNVYLSGTVSKSPKYSHELYGEGFYEFALCVLRLSGQCDYIPVTVSERLMSGVDLSEGARVALNGQFRSYNKMENAKSKLMLTVFVRDFVDLEEGKNPNTAELMGYICKAPVYRTTPFNREICDVLLAVNRAYNKSDYIPCIAWGRNARFVRDIEVGQKIAVTGRIQSREYTKKLSETESEIRVAYELSIGKIVRGDELPQDEIAATPSAEHAAAEAAEDGILPQEDA
ncbi:MAG: single-stranded DNA-binding protein [Clostridiales bacterium]|nr:single-stranded DNA-binding protein [Clostridiales bacterium]